MVKRVFNWKKFATALLDDDGFTNDKFGYDNFLYDIGNSWVSECIGKTNDEINDIGYAYENDWLDEIETSTAEDFKALEIGTPIRVVYDGYEPNTFIGEFIAVKDGLVIVAIPEDVVANFYDCEVSLAYDGFRPDFCEIIERNA